MLIKQGTCEFQPQNLDSCDRLYKMFLGLLRYLYEMRLLNLISQTLMAFRFVIAIATQELVSIVRIFLFLRFRTGFLKFVT